VAIIYSIFDPENTQTIIVDITHLCPGNRDDCLADLIKPRLRAFESVDYLISQYH